MAGSCFPRSQRSEPIFLRAAVEPSPPPPCLIPGGYQHFSGAPCWDGQQTLPADPATPALRPHPHPQNVVQYVSFTVSPWPKISNKFISSRSHGNHFEFLLGQLFWPNVPTVPVGGGAGERRRATRVGSVPPASPAPPAQEAHVALWRSLRPSLNSHIFLMSADLEGFIPPF